MSGQREGQGVHTGYFQKGLVTVNNLKVKIKNERVSTVINFSLFIMKRYCQTLELYDDKELIEAYVAEHAHVWEEVKAGIREVGITDMQIYIDGNRLFMIMDTTDEFDMERDYARLATLPRQAEWEAHMAKFQKAAPGATSQEKWKLMKRIFKL